MPGERFEDKFDPGGGDKPARFEDRYDVGAAVAEEEPPDQPQSPTPTAAPLAAAKADVSDATKLDVLDRMGWRENVDPVTLREAEIRHGRPTPGTATQGAIAAWEKTDRAKEVRQAALSDLAGADFDMFFPEIKSEQDIDPIRSYLTIREANAFRAVLRLRAAGVPSREARDAAGKSGFKQTAASKKAQAERPFYQQMLDEAGDGDEDFTTEEQAAKFLDAISEFKEAEYAKGKGTLFAQNIAREFFSGLMGADPFGPQKTGVRVLGKDVIKGRATVGTDPEHLADLDREHGERGFLGKTAQAAVGLVPAVMWIGAGARGANIGLEKAGISAGRRKVTSNMLAMGTHSVVHGGSFSEGAAFAGFLGLFGPAIGKVLGATTKRGPALMTLIASVHESATFVAAGAAMHGFDLDQAAVDAVIGAALGARGKTTLLRLEKAQAKFNTAKTEAGRDAAKAEWGKAYQELRGVMGPKEGVGRVEAQEAAKPIEAPKPAKPPAPKAPQVVGDIVDGRVVRKDVPNLSSIEASGLKDSLGGVREVRMEEFTLDESPIPKDANTIRLAKEIEASGEINPLIVAYDAKGPYIVEGAHRYDALRALGAKSFPAVVVAEPGFKFSEPAAPKAPGEGQGVTKPHVVEAQNALRRAVRDKVPEGEIDKLRTDLTRALAGDAEDGVVQMQSGLDPRPAAKAVARKVAPWLKAATDVATGELGSAQHRIGQSGKPVAMEMRDLVKKANDVTKAALGRLAPIAKKAKQMTGASLLTKRGRAATELSKEDKVSVDVEGAEGSYGSSRNIAAIERDAAADAKANNPGQQEIINSERALVRETGLLAEEAGLEKLLPDGTRVPIKASPEGRIAPRQGTQEFLDLVMDGDVDALPWKTFVASVDHMNGLKKGTADKIFRELRDQRITEALDKGTRTDPLEHTRGFQFMPSSITTPKVAGDPFSNRTIKIQETSAAGWVRTLEGRTTSRVGAAVAFGQNFNGEVDALRSRFIQEFGGRSQKADDEFSRVMRGVSGVAQDPPILKPGGITAPLGRGLGAAGQVVKSLMLSRQLIVNLPEPLGPIRDAIGNRALGKVAMDFFGQTKAWKADLKEAVDKGMVTEEVGNASVDPTRIFSSGARGLANRIGRVTGGIAINESQEAMAAVGYLRQARIMQANKGTGKFDDFDVQNLRAMDPDLTRQEAVRLASGEGTQAEYDTLGRVFGGQATGATLTSTEKSKTENRRLLKNVAIFKTFGLAIARDSARKLSSFAKVWRESSDPSSPGYADAAARSSAKRAAMGALGRWVTGKTVGGLVIQLATEAAKGGSLGASIFLKEFLDDPVGKAANAFLTQVTVGPIGTVSRQIGDGSLEDSLFPWMVGKEVFQATSATGRYSNKRKSDRARMFFRRMTPVLQPAVRAYNAWVLGDVDSGDIQTAARSYWRIKFDQGDATTRSGGGANDYDEFKVQVNAAAAAFQRNDPKAAEKFMDAAFDIDNDKNDKQKVLAIRNRRLLSGPNGSWAKKNEAKLRRLGIWGPLEAHDEAIDALADSYLSPRDLRERKKRERRK